MSLVDSHCHIHEADYPLDREAVLCDAIDAGVTKIICVGTEIQSSRDAVKFANSHNNVWAVIGVHPHDAKNLMASDYDILRELAANSIRPGLAKKIVGIGEIGLDYFYEFSPRAKQIAALEQQLQIAVDNNLPVSFHIRAGDKNGYSALDDFWAIFDNFGEKIRGVLHSFTDNRANMEKGLVRGLFVGVNGIATFNKNPEQRAMYEAIPLESMILETDAPFLSPSPHRGKPNQPAYVREVAKFVSDMRGRDLKEVAQITAENANRLFFLQ